MEIPRTPELEILEARIRSNPVVGILGPRQCGKSTLARQFARRRRAKDVHYFDLEDPRDMERLEQPLLTLEAISGVAVLDEIQRAPELFPVLRVLADRRRDLRFLLLGSASPDLVKRSTESLAGRISYIELGGFGLEHLEKRSISRLWARGGFPRSFLAPNDLVSNQWRLDFIQTFLERDLPALGFQIPARTLRKFWMMLAHYHGQIFNASEIGKSLGLSDHTARRYVDLLSGTFLIRQLQPWFSNTRKRLVKRPKVYFRDSGLFHALLGVSSSGDLKVHPKLGASWEGFALEQVVHHLGLREEEAHFWALHTGPEVDLVFQQKGRLWGVEAKYADAPSFTPSMRSALKELDLAHLWVVYPGRTRYPLNPHVTALPLEELSELKPR
jgi:hypothetical protein